MNRKNISDSLEQTRVEVLCNGHFWACVFSISIFVVLIADIPMMTKHWL